MYLAARKYVRRSKGFLKITEYQGIKPLMMMMSNTVKTPKNKPWYEFHENKVKEGVS